MKLYCVSADDYEKQASVLEEYRRQGNMVFLYGDCSRACMKRRHIREANVFGADGGEFVFSGCYSLFESRSGYLAETVRFLQKHHVRYAFRLEDAAFCGGTLDTYVSDPSLVNEDYTYLVRFDDEKQKDAVLAECAAYCTFRFLNDSEAYLIFNDSDPRKSVPTVCKALRLKEEDIIFLNSSDI